MAGRKEHKASLSSPLSAALAPLEKPSNDTSESCEILEAVTDGEYRAIFNSTLQKILFLEVTNELGTSQFESNYTESEINNLEINHGGLNYGSINYVLVFTLIAIGIVICVFGLIYIYYRQKGKVGATNGIYMVNR